MTVRECFEEALGFLPELPEENPEIKKFAVNWCNFLLSETFRNENFYREANKIEKLAEIPKLWKIEDEIPYNEELVKTAFPYGMARFIFRENGDISGSREFYQLYVIALSEATPVVLREVEDIYR